MYKKKSTKLEFFRRNNKSTIVLILEVAMQKAEAQIQETEEKSCCKRDHLSAIFWGILLIFLGVLLMLVEFNYLYSDEWFAFFVFGLGVLMVGDYILRQFSTTLRTANVAKLIFGILFIIVSANHVFYLSDWWPLLLVVAGGIMVWSSFRKKENNVELSSH